MSHVFYKHSIIILKCIKQKLRINSEYDRPTITVEEEYTSLRINQWNKQKM